MNTLRRILRPDRIRLVEHPFGWIPRRLVSSGLLADLDPPEKLLYLFLAIVADRHGISFFGHARICRELRLTPHDLEAARRALVRRDLIATRGLTVQLLSLPQPTLVRPPSFVDRSHSELEPIRTILHRLLAHRTPTRDPPS